MKEEFLAWAGESGLDSMESYIKKHSKDGIFADFVNLKVLSFVC